MPTARITPDLEMHYEVDDYTDPWTESETVLLLHGNADSARCASETLDFIRCSRPVPSSCHSS